jgi:hypothetical protein
LDFKGGPPPPSSTPPKCMYASVSYSAIHVACDSTVLLPPFIFSTGHVNKSLERFERRILDEFVKMYNDSDSFYFSFTGDMTNSMQRQMSSTQNLVLAGNSKTKDENDAGAQLRGGAAALGGVAILCDQGRNLPNGGKLYPPSHFCKKHFLTNSLTKSLK